jgi:hypothetical protein
MQLDDDHSRPRDLQFGCGSPYAATQKVLYKRAHDSPQPQWREVWNTRRDRSLAGKYGADMNPGRVKQGFYIERWREGGEVRHAVREIHDATRPAPEWLARVRSVCESPFTGEKGRVIYASGFSPWGVKVSNTGWIYRGQFQTPTNP